MSAILDGEALSLANLDAAISASTYAQYLFTTPLMVWRLRSAVRRPSPKHRMRQRRVFLQQRFSVRGDLRCPRTFLLREAKP